MTQSATNYGHENTLQSSGESIPIYGDQPEGPFWTSPDLHPEYHYPSCLVMVKPHCGGRCESSCPPQRMLNQPKAFNTSVQENDAQLSTEHGLILRLPIL